MRRSNSKKTPLKLLANQSGQGVIEYILVLLVTVAIVLGAVFQLNDAFRLWANNYFGNYLSCLIESGELPALGGEDGEAGICNDQFQAFSLASGRPGSEALGPGSGSGSTDSNSNSNGSGGGSRGSSRPDGGAGGASYVSAGRTGRFGRGSGGGSGGKGGGTVNTFAKSKTDSSGVTTMQVSKINTGSTGSSVTTESARRINYGSFKKDKKDVERVPLRGKKNKGSGTEKDLARLRIKKIGKKTVIPEDEAWSFGDWFRILIIAALIIALVVFLAGQFLQISKSME